MKTLYIIDGYAQFFRAYHAIRTPMTSPVTKEPTNMTFGFVGMMLKLLRGEGAMGGAPDYVAVALDVSGDRGTFRSQLYDAYKANRPPPPEDLRPQVDRCLSVLKAIGVPVIGAEGFEADDVIATIATAWSERHPDVRVRIISKDKDLKQLLGAGSPPTEMYDLHTDLLITAQSLHDELHISPAQVIDMLTLMGDTVDNVPGVEGIGPKTAAQLIAEFGSLEAVLAEVESDKPEKERRIKGKRREKILEARAHLPLSRQLVSLRHDVPVSLDLDAARAECIDLAALLPLLRELGFNRYQDEVRLMLGQSEGGAVSPMPTTPSAEKAPAASRIVGGLFDTIEDQSAPPRADGDYTCVTTPEQLEQVVQAMRTGHVVAIDTETTGLRPMWAHLCGISCSVEEGKGWYIPVRAPAGEAHLSQDDVVRALRDVLQDEKIPKVGHNIKYDLIVLRRHGLHVRGHQPTSARTSAGDSMIASSLIDASRSSHAMDALALALLKRENISIKDLIGVGKNQRTFDQVPLALASEYAAEDADVTLQLANRMVPQLRAMGLEKVYREVEMPLVDVLAEMEWNGVLIDPAELDRQRARLESRLVELRREIADSALNAVGRTFDPDSPKQLGSVLFNKPEAAEPGLGLPAGRKTKTGYSTDAEVLENLVDDPAVTSDLPRLILEYRQLSKLVNTYLVNLVEEIHPQTKRIHASFHQTGAATGRLSSSDPNLQNIPIRTDLGREIRRAFVAPEGHVLITADYSQIELRLLAHLSRDPGLIAAFEAGEDIHRAVAAQIHGVPLDEVTREQRNGAKMVNFGIVYGITAFGLARRLKIGNAEAAEIIDDYKRKFAGITTFLEECIAQAKRKGSVETMLGRRRPIVDIESSNPNRRSLAERVAINSVVQGSAADLIKLAMIDLHGAIGSASAPDPLCGVRMLIQIHDELVFECPEERAEVAKAEIVRRMEGAMSLRVPIVAEAAAGRTWFDGK